MDNEHKIYLVSKAETKALMQNISEWFVLSTPRLVLLIWTMSLSLVALTWNLDEHDHHHEHKHENVW